MATPGLLNNPGVAIAFMVNEGLKGVVLTVSFGQFLPQPQELARAKAAYLEPGISGGIGRGHRAIGSGIGACLPVTARQPSQAKQPEQA